MAVAKGIEALQLQGANGVGNAALMLSFGTLRILSKSGFSYKTATIADRRQVNAGSVTYQTPEIVKAENYGTGTTAFQKLSSGIVEVAINIRRTIKYTYEQFDYSRLGSWTQVVSMIQAIVATAVENDLNMHFWNFVVSQMNLTNGTLKQQNLTLPDLLPDMTNIGGNTLPNIDNIRLSIMKINLLANKLSKTYNLRQLGMKPSEMMFFVAPEVDTVIRQAYWNQPNALGERPVAKDLTGTQLGGGLYYYTDAMLNNNIPADSSFSKDVALDTTGFAGFLIHNEAIAMPFNFMGVIGLQDQDSGNPRFIVKYQFGLGVLRPDLIYSISKTAPTT